MKQVLLTTIIVLSTALGAFAQKYGHLNSSQLLVSLPEVKAADTELESFQKELYTKGEQMAKAFQDEYNSYMQKANAGQLSQIQMQEAEATLSQKQTEIQQYEVNMQNQLAAKKQELYQPILTKVQEKVEEIAKAEGYTMVFDTSMGGLLFVEDSQDLMAMMKAKFGVQ